MLHAQNGTRLGLCRDLICESAEEFFTIPRATGRVGNRHRDNIHWNRMQIIIKRFPTFAGWHAISWIIKIKYFERYCVRAEPSRVEPCLTTLWKRSLGSSTRFSSVDRLDPCNFSLNACESVSALSITIVGIIADAKDWIGKLREQF